MSASFLNPDPWLPILLSLTFIVCAFGSSPPCPSGCRCRDDNYVPFGDVLTVSCFDLTQIPDLSSLRETKMGKNLRLDDNFLKTVDKSDFPPGLNITVLNLSQNKGLSISEDAFLNLGSSLKILKLEAIDLPFNGTLTMLEPLFSLQELNLRYNNKHPYVKGAVQDIDIPLLRGEITKSIVTLNLAFCSIRTLSATSLDNLSKLKSLDLSNNWFTSVPKVIEYLPTLTFLELFYCHIETVKNYDFHTLKHLKALDLASNSKLSTFEPKAFHGCADSLEKLVLFRCNLTAVPHDALKTLKKLTYLDLSENNFKTIEPVAFEGDYKLKQLLISAPYLEFDEDMFRGQEENIDNLSMLRMGLMNIPIEPLKKLSNLSHLSLGHNEITILPAKAFEGIKATVLDLSDNPVSHIDPMAFDGLSPDLVIDLTNTEMDNIDFLVDYPETAIHSVRLKNSKLVCRCSMKSSLNVTLYVNIFGSCAKGGVSIPISSTRLEGILDEACEEEKAAGNSGLKTARWDSDSQLKVVLGLALGVVICRHVELFYTKLF